MIITCERLTSAKNKKLNRKQKIFHQELKWNLDWKNNFSLFEIWPDVFFFFFLFIMVVVVLLLVVQASVCDRTTLLDVDCTVTNDYYMESEKFNIFGTKPFVKNTNTIRFLFYLFFFIYNGETTFLYLRIVWRCGCQSLFSRILFVFLFWNNKHSKSEYN